MTDVQTAPAPQPSVFDAVPTVSAPVSVLASNRLTRPSGTVLHVVADQTYLHVGRRLIGTCTREEWASPSHRRLAIARAWDQAVKAIRAEDEEFVSWRIVTLYHDPLAPNGTDDVYLADISLPGMPATWITPMGRPVLVPDRLVLARCIKERTSYARWAEGPLPHVTHDPIAAPTPDDDRDVQWLRHQNSALRDLIDTALAPSEWAPLANDAGDDALVDFRIRGVFRRQDYSQLISKQTGEVSGLLIGGGTVEVPPEVTAAVTTEQALDALLNAN